MDQKEIVQNLKVLSESQQFVIGEEYLVVPVTKEGENTRDIYFPGEGSCWQNWFNKAGLDKSYVILL